MSEFSRIEKTRAGDFDHLVKTQPLEIVGELIDAPSIVYEDGIPKLGYFFAPPALLKDIRRIVRATKIQKSSRTNGLPTQSTIYGVMPRNNLRVDYCRFTASSRKEKEFFVTMNNYCEVMCEMYERYFPENYAAALAEVQGSIDKDWVHNKTPFQTININVNHAIKYHRDTGNFRSAMSTVLIVKDEMEGGQLPVPEYDLTLSQRDGAFTIFDGQSLLHGVLPIKRRTPQGYRASIVFYSMNALKKIAIPYQDEIDRLAEREKNKAPVRYSLENKRELVRMNRRALERSNSPYLKLLEEDEKNVDGTICGDEKKDGVTGPFETRVGTSDQKAVLEVWKKNSYQRKQFQVVPGERWLDLGSNIGAFSVYAGLRGCEVWAYEADEYNAGVTATNIEINGLESRARVTRAAIVRDDYVGDSIDFYINSRPMALRRHSIYEPKKNGTKITVPAIKFSDLPLGDYDAIKMNIEGSEIDLLEQVQGFGGIKRLVFEYSFDKDPSIARFQAILTKLRGHFRYVDHNKSMPKGSDVWIHYPPNIFVYCMR